MGISAVPCSGLDRLGNPCQVQRSQITRIHLALAANTGCQRFKKQKYAQIFIFNLPRAASSKVDSISELHVVVYIWMAL
jgi:hypothetical protein